MNSNIIYKIENKNRSFQQKRQTGYMRDLFDKVLTNRPVTSLIEHHYQDQLFQQNYDNANQLPALSASTMTPKMSNLKRPDGAKTAKKQVKFESTTVVNQNTTRITHSAAKTSIYAPPAALPANQNYLRNKILQQPASLSSVKLLRSFQASHSADTGGVPSIQHRDGRFKSALKDTKPVDSGRQQQQTLLKLPNLDPTPDKNFKTALRTSDVAKLSSILNLRGDKMSPSARKPSFAKTIETIVSYSVENVEKRKNLMKRFRKAVRSLLIILKMLTIHRTAKEKMKKFEFKDGYDVSFY
jgi:hypothetical protein